MTRAIPEKEPPKAPEMTGCNADKEQHGTDVGALALADTWIPEELLTRATSFFEKRYNRKVTREDAAVWLNRIRAVIQLCRTAKRRK